MSSDGNFLKVKVVKDFIDFKKDQVFEFHGDFIILTGENGIGKTILFKSENESQNKQVRFKYFKCNKEEEEQEMQTDGVYYYKRLETSTNSNFIETIDNIEIHKNCGKENHEVNDINSKPTWELNEDQKIKIKQITRKNINRSPFLHDRNLTISYDEHCQEKSDIGKDLNETANKFSSQEEFITSWNTRISPVEMSYEFILMDRLSDIVKDGNYFSGTNDNKNQIDSLFYEYEKELKEFNITFNNDDFIKVKNIELINKKVPIKYKSTKSTNKDWNKKETLSTGEKLYLDLINLKFSLKDNQKALEYIILDEIDYPINCRNYNNLVDIIQTVFINKGVKVILITHNEGLIYYLSKNQPNIPGISFYEMERKVDDNAIEVIQVDDPNKLSDLVYISKNNGNKTIYFEGKTDISYVKNYLDNKYDISGISFSASGGADSLIARYENTPKKEGQFYFSDGDRASKKLKGKETEPNVFVLEKGAIECCILDDKFKEVYNEDRKTLILLKRDFQDDEFVEINECSFILTAQAAEDIEKDENYVFDNKQIRRITACQKKSKNHECHRFNSKDEFANKIKEKFLEKGTDVFNDDFKKGIKKIVKYFDLKEKQKL